MPDWGSPPAPPRRPLTDAAASNPDAVMAWLPRVDADGKPIKWTQRDAERLVFLRKLFDAGKVSDG